MRRKKGFNLRWKLAENYAAAIVGVLFLWLFIRGVVYEDTASLVVSLLILAVAPFLVSYLDKKAAQ